MKVPRDLFIGIHAELDYDKSAPFRKMLMERYPWLTENSVDVLLKKAKQEMARTIDDESHGRLIARELESNGRIDDALRHLRKYLEIYPDDPDSWYMLGDILCKSGKTDEGYKAFARGRDLF